MNTLVRPRDDTDAAPSSAVLGAGATSFWLSGALAVVSVLAAALTFWVPGILTGPAVMNGSARGTALVVLVLVVPTMTASIGPAARGSARALAIWMGALAYLAYNAVMFLFGTPFNPLFLVYVAMLSLSAWSLASLARQGNPTALVSRHLPVRSIAAYIWAVTFLNGVIWLRTVVPALTADRPTAFLDGTGIVTSPVFVQDLALWLPAMAVIGFLLWRRRPWGILLAAAGLVFWVMESVGVAVDQWFGSTADPASAVASMSAVPLFAVVAAVGLIPTWLLLRAFPASSGLTVTSPR